MVDKIYKYFGQDGLLHILCSSIIVGLADLVLPLWIAVIIAALIGLGKEFIYDKWMAKGTFDTKDLVADFVGIIIGML